MNWLYETLWQHTPVQAVVIICLICALGLALGKLRFRGISLGVTYVFFIGILFGALGLQLDAQMLSYAESFGLILFVYTLGLQVGPGFMSTFLTGGAQLNLLALGVVGLGTVRTLLAALLGYMTLPCRQRRDTTNLESSTPLPLRSWSVWWNTAGLHTVKEAMKASSLLSASRAEAARRCSRPFTRIRAIITPIMPMG